MKQQNKTSALKEEIRQEYLQFYNDNHKLDDYVLIDIAIRKTQEADKQQIIKCELALRSYIKIKEGLEISVRDLLESNSVLRFKIQELERWKFTAKGRFEWYENKIKDLEEREQALLLTGGTLKSEQLKLILNTHKLETIREVKEIIDNIHQNNRSRRNVCKQIKEQLRRL